MPKYQGCKQKLITKLSFISFVVLFLSFAFAKSAFANNAGINIGTNYGLIDQAIDAVKPGGWIVVIAGGTGDCSSLETIFSKTSAAGVNVVIRGHLGNQLTPDDALGWTATLGRTNTYGQKVYFMPWNEPNQAGSADAGDPTAVVAYTNALATNLADAGLRGTKVKLLSPMLNHTWVGGAGDVDNYANSLGGAAYFSSFDGVAMNLYDIADNCSPGSYNPLCSTDQHYNPLLAPNLFFAAGKPVYGVEAGPAGQYFYWRGTSKAGSYVYEFTEAFKPQTSAVMFALAAYDLAGEVGHRWSLFNPADTINLLMGGFGGTEQDTSDPAVFESWLVAHQGDLVQCSAVCGFAPVSNPGLCTATGGLGESCEQPLAATPDEGCFNCNFSQETLASEERKNDLITNVCELLGLNTICRDFFDIGSALSWNATINVKKLTSPVDDNMFSNWYGNMLPNMLPPDLAKDVLDNEEIAANTSSRVQLRGEQLSGGGDIQIQSGEGSIFKAVGQQFASVMMDCLITGTPNDTWCKTVKPTLASQMNYLASLPENTAMARAPLPKTEEKKSSIGLDTLIASSLWGKSSQELNSLNSNLQTLVAQSSSIDDGAGGEVLAASALCPEKKETAVTNPCLKQIAGKEVKSTGTNKKEKRDCAETMICTPVANNPGGLDCKQQGPDCDPSMDFTNLVSIHPDFDFVTGSVGDQKAAFPANNHTFSAIFDLPNDYILNLYPVIKPGYQSRVDFVVERGASGVNRIPILGDVIEAVAHFLIQFNESDGANVPDGGERDCREQRAALASLAPPDTAKDVETECVRDPNYVLPGLCNGFPCTCGTDVIDWTNANTRSLRNSPALSSFGSSTGKIQGKIILSDGASKVLYNAVLPTNPGQNFRGFCKTASPVVVLYRKNLNDNSDWDKTKDSVYMIGSMPEGLHHIRVNLSVPPGKYIFSLDPATNDIPADACFHELSVESANTDSSRVIVVQNTATADKCFVLKANSNMPGGHTSIVGDPQNITNYCDVDYDTGYNRMCGGLNADCSDSVARCGFLRTISGWPQGGDSCRTMFPSTFQIASCSSITEPPTTLADLNVSDISCPSENICFAAAHTLAPSGVENRAFLGNTTDGINWTFKRASYTEGTELANLEIVPRIKFINSTAGWLVAKSEGTVRNVILKTVDGGNTWTRQASEGIDTKNYQSFDMLTSTLGFVGPSSGIATSGILYTSNGGEGEKCSYNPNAWCPTWKKQSVTSSIRDTNNLNSALDISFYSADNVMISANGHRMYNLSNTGGSWNLTGGIVSGCDGNGSLGTNMERVRMLSDSLGYAAGNRCVAKYEGGVWAKLSGFDAVSYRGLDAKESTQIFAAENGAVYILHRGGTPEKIVLPNAGKLLSVEIIGNTVYVGGDRGKIYISRDLGITWEEQKSIVLQGQ